MAQANLEVIGLMMRKEKKEVLADITITPQSILIREKVAAQVHPLSEIIRGLGCMSYGEK